MRVPLPAVLMGLGMIAAPAHQAQAAKAVDDNFTVAANGSLTAVSLLTNDTYNGNSYAVVGHPASHGSAVVDGTGLLNYKPDPGFSGADSFTYVLIDRFGNSSAQVNILVSAPPAAPTLGTAALLGLSGLLAFFGMRRRRKD